MFKVFHSVSKFLKSSATWTATILLAFVAFILLLQVVLRYLFNAALAQTLNKDYTGALKTLDCMEEGCAMTDYLKAIVYARQAKSDNMFKALEAAVSAKPELKEMAKTDVEFGKYFEDAKFKAIVQ